MFRKFFLIFIFALTFCIGQFFIFPHHVKAQGNWGEPCLTEEPFCNFSYSCISNVCCDPTASLGEGEFCNCNADCISSNCTSGICEPPPPPAPSVLENPPNGKELTNEDLNDDFSLTLAWQSVWDNLSESGWYYSQYWEEGGTPSLPALATGEEAHKIISYDELKPGVHYFWHVKSCADANADGISECSNYSDPTWSFVYPAEAVINFPTEITVINVVPNEQNPNGIQISWNGPNNTPANSYLIDAKIDTGGCTWSKYAWSLAQYIPIGPAPIGVPIKVIRRFSCFFHKCSGGGGSCDLIEKNIVQPIVDKFKSWFPLFQETCPKGYDPSCPWVLWNVDDCTCGQIPILKTEKIITNLDGSTSTEQILESVYNDDTCIFSRGEEYKIKIASCLDDDAERCGKFSGKIDFTVSANFPIPVPTPKGPIIQIECPEPTPENPNPECPEIAPVDLNSPDKIPVIGKNHSLQWEAPDCANYIRLVIKNLNGILIIKNKNGTPLEMPSVESFDFSNDDAKELFDEPNDLNKIYSWQLQSCWRVKNEIKCDEGEISPKWYFKTIGAPPSLTKPADNETVKIPVKLAWEKIDGAGSYSYQLSDDPNFNHIINLSPNDHTSFSFAEFNYPTILSNHQYWWRVETCADDNGGVCGKQDGNDFWNETRSFTTFPLSAPAEPVAPINNGTTFLPGYISWKEDPGANFYQYKVDAGTIENEEVPLEGCSGLLNGQEIKKGITNNTSVSLNLNCLGKYTWKVRSCLDSACDESKTPPTVSGWSNSWEFTALQRLEREKGILPCGRYSDATSTPYNEREPCQLKHVGLLAQNIIDFLLWKLSWVVLILTIGIAAFVSYMSMGAPEAINSAKSILKSALTGMVLLFIAWSAINLILAAFGFQVEFFGHWFKLPF